MRRLSPTASVITRLVLMWSLPSFVAACAAAQPAPDQQQQPAGPGSTTGPAGLQLKQTFPHVHLDADKHQVWVEAETLATQGPLEFFCCRVGTNEYEAVLHSPAKASDVHTCLLILGLKPGTPVHYSDAAQKWFPPSGPPLHVSVAYVDDNGKQVMVPAYRLMRDIKTKRPMPPTTWVFTGSRVLDDGSYAADQTGYLVSVVNFELSMVDVPQIASSANETLEWEINPDALPKAGTRVWMVLEPAGNAQAAGGENAAESPMPATQPGVTGAPVDLPVVKIGAGRIELGGQRLTIDELGQRLKSMSPERKRELRLAIADDAEPEMVRQVRAALADAGITPAEVVDGSAGAATGGAGTLSDVHIDQAKVDRLQALWDQKVAPHAAALSEAAQAHYEVINELRREQQRLINEADRIQRKIDELDRQYQDMTTPRPAGTSTTPKQREEGE